MAGQGWTDKRPMSPHLQIWKFHPTMLTSILHRATGVANAAGLVVVIGWLFAASTGPDYYAKYDAVFTGIIGKVVLFAFTVSIFFHLFNGVRYLFWDSGKGFSPNVANFWSVAALVFGLFGAVAAWIAAGLVPLGA